MMQVAVRRSRGGTTVAAEMESELYEALDRGHIVPHFQPQVQLRTGSLTGFEVLARWNHPYYGLISPDEFIPLAETSGLIDTLTETILRQTFAAVAPFGESFSLSINISATQLRHPCLPQQVRRAAEKHSFPLQRLTIEITESALIENREQAISVASGLKKLGAHLALDDFGTGYSSLIQLQAFPFDEIKVDRSFVRSMCLGRESRKIVAAVIGLGHSLGLTTVAEGVEHQGQAEMLLRLGCEIGQGWYYGRPVPARELPQVLYLRSVPAGVSASVSVPSSIASCFDALPAHRLAEFQAIYDGAPVGLCFLDTKLRYVSINQRLADSNNVPVSAHLGRRVADVTPHVFRQVEPYLDRALAGEIVTGVEISKPLAGLDTQTVTLLASYQPARDEAGEVVGVSVAVVDITDRKRIEEALRASEEHYRHMVDLNPQIPWTLQPDGSGLEVSSRWQQLTGMTVEQAANGGWTKALHPEDAARAGHAVSTSLHTGEPIDVQYRLKLRNGQWCWMQCRGTPLRALDGSIVRWYGSVEDISERKRLEEALKKSDARLNALLSRTREGPSSPRPST